MKVCPNCGKKLGLFNKKIECKICAKEFCNKCYEWDIMLGTSSKYAWGGDNMEGFQVCSEKCAFNSYLTYIKSTKDNMALILTNENNIGFSVTEDHENKPKGISIAYMRTNHRAAPKEGEGFIPQIKPLYDKIINDIKDRKRKFKEEYMNI